MRNVENIMVFYKKQCTYNPIKTYGHKRKSNASKSLKQNQNIKMTDIYGNHFFVPYDSTERYPLQILQFKSDKQKSNLHPTQKPVSLLEYLIKTYTNENDTILDNCMGSGSTGVACVNTHRNFIGIELDVNYFNISEERIQNLKGLNYEYKRLCK